MPLKKRRETIMRSTQKFHAKKQEHPKVWGIPIEEIVKPHHKNKPAESIKKKYPRIAQEWYFKKNCGFSPEQFSRGSNVNAWWQCRNNYRHIWRARISERCRGIGNCPDCRRPGRPCLTELGTRSLGKVFPLIAKEWHKTKNGKLTPFDVFCHANGMFWWQCKTDKRHVWQASVQSRTLGSGCQICAELRILNLENYPKAFRYFDKEKNKGVDPRRLGSSRVVWWICPKGRDHKWKSRFTRQQAHIDPLCPFCRNRKLSVTNSLAALYPRIARELHPTRNGSLTAAKLRMISLDHVWWRCRKNASHTWNTSVRNRTINRTGCPHCFWERRGVFRRLLPAYRNLR